MPIIADLTPSAGPTLPELVTQIVTTVQGFAVAPDKLLTLKTPLTDSELTMTVEGEASPGLFEVDDELVYVTSVDLNTGTCTLHPRGRGWLGTTAAAHSTGAVVVDGPALPRSRATQLVNDVVNSLFPQVFGVGTTVAVKDGLFFEVPSDCEFILDVRALDDDEWVRVSHWEAEMSSAVGDTGKVVRLPRVADGTTVQVTFGHRPEVLTDDTQRWSSTGLSIGLKDVVVLGVLARFAQTIDIGRLTDRFTTPRGDAQQPQLGSGFAMARQIKTDFQAALDREAKALRDLYPARVHFVR